MRYIKVLINFVLGVVFSVACGFAIKSLVWELEILGLIIGGIVILKIITKLGFKILFPLFGSSWGEAILWGYLWVLTPAMIILKTLLAECI